MALTECPDCGGKVSSVAAACPHCGRPNRDAGAAATEWLLGGSKQEGPFPEALLIKRILDGRMGPQKDLSQDGGKTWIEAQHHAPFNAAFARRAETQKGTEEIGSRILRAAMIVIVVAVGGYFLGRHYPLFSDPMTQKLCQPTSPCRDASAQSYAIAGLVLGGLLALMNDVLVRMQAAKKGA